MEPGTTPGGGGSAPYEEEEASLLVVVLDADPASWGAIHGECVKEKTGVCVCRDCCLAPWAWGRFASHTKHTTLCSCVPQR